MGEILKKAKIPIIIIIVLALSFVIYNKVFKKGEESTELERTSESGGRKSPSQDFLPLLNLIKSVDFDDKFFSDVVFKSMVDFSVPIKEEDKGRDNPFSPGIISSEENVASVGVVFDNPDEGEVSTTTQTVSTTTPPRTGGGR